MLVARVLAAAVLVSSLTFGLAPAIATEPVPTDPEAKAVIRRILPTPPVAAPKREGPAPTPAADSADGPLERRLDQVRELANLRLQVAALQRALEALVASIERAIQRPEPAIQRPAPAPTPPAPAKRPTAVPGLADIAAPPAPRDRCGTSSRATGSRSPLCSPPTGSPSPKNPSPAPSW